MCDEKPPTDKPAKPNESPAQPPKNIPPRLDVQDLLVYFERSRKPRPKRPKR